MEHQNPQPIHPVHPDLRGGAWKKMPGIEVVVAELVKELGATQTTTVRETEKRPIVHLSVCIGS